MFQTYLNAWLTCHQVSPEMVFIAGVLPVSLEIIKSSSCITGNHPFTLSFSWQPSVLYICKFMQIKGDTFVPRYISVSSQNFPVLKLEIFRPNFHLSFLFLPLASHLCLFLFSFTLILLSPSAHTHGVLSATVQPGLTCLPLLFMLICVREREFQQIRIWFNLLQGKAAWYQARDRGRLWRNIDLILSIRPENHIPPG